MAHVLRLHPDAPPVPPGKRARPDLEFGCGRASCTDCYEDQDETIETTYAVTIRAVVSLAGDRHDQTAIRSEVAARLADNTIAFTVLARALDTHGL